MGFRRRSSRPLKRTPKSRKSFSISRNILAHLVAAHASGNPDAIPTGDDYILADQFIDMIDKRYK